MIESVPKEFNMDDRETTEDLYETPYEISMLRVSTKSVTRGYRYLGNRVTIIRWFPSGREVMIQTGFSN